jgi:hypothetical protein
MEISTCSEGPLKWNQSPAATFERRANKDTRRGEIYSHVRVYLRSINASPLLAHPSSYRPSASSKCRSVPDIVINM